MTDTSTFPAPLSREPRRLVPKRTAKYRDNIQTPRYLADQVVGHFRPSGNILEACAGDGSFMDALRFAPGVRSLSHCEIRPSRELDPDGGCLYGSSVVGGGDFFDWKPRGLSWVVTNPPYSLVTPFLEHAMHVADNVLFLILLNAAFFTSRLRVMQDLQFGLREVLVVETPPEWKSLGLGFGVPFAAVHWQRGYTGGVRGFGGFDLALPAGRPRKRRHVSLAAG